MKRIIEMTTNELGFSESHDEIRPVKKSWRNGDAFPMFVDTNVKILLDDAKKIGGFVLLIDETLTTYSSQRVHACPDCGWPMRVQGRGATLKKHGNRYVCARAETRRGLRMADDKHTYVRAWTEDEMNAQSEDARIAAEI